MYGPRPIGWPPARRRNARHRVRLGRGRTRCPCRARCGIGADKQGLLPTPTHRSCIEITEPTHTRPHTGARKLARYVVRLKCCCCFRWRGML